MNYKGKREVRRVSTPVKQTPFDDGGPLFVDPLVEVSFSFHFTLNFSKSDELCC